MSSEAAWNGHSRGSAGYRRLLVALFAAGVATFAQLYSPQAVLPQISHDLKVSAASSALLVSAGTLGLAIAVIPWSAVADRFGRVRSMSIAIIAATVFGLLVPFAPTFSLLLTGRVLEGLMLGGVPALAIAYLNEELAPANAVRAAGTFIAGNTIGGLSGRLIAGPIAEVTTWRIGVMSVALLCAVASVLFVWAAPRSRGFEPVARRHNPDGGLAHRLLANLRSPRLFVLYLQAALLTGGFVAMYNYLGFRLALPPFLLPQTFISLIFVAYLAGTFSSSRGSLLAARFGRQRVMVASIVIMMVGVLLTLSGWLPVVLIGLVVATGGYFSAHAIAAGWAGREAVVGRAQSSSLYNLFFYVGSSLFGWLGGIFFGGFGWPGTVGMIMVAALVCTTLATVVLRPKPEEAATPAVRQS